VATVRAVWLLLAFAGAALVSALATPIAARVARAIGAVDRPNARKVNRRPDIPLLGGLAVAFGFTVGLSIALLFLQDVSNGPRIEGLLTGGFVVLGLGAFDDRFELSPRTKLLGQFLAAAIAIHAGFQINHVTDPVTHTVLQFSPIVAWIVTLGWIIIVTNSVNLIDGLDGLCAGVSAIIALTLVAIAWQNGAFGAVAVGLALVGALLGFLPFNFPPARVFVGDTGALFIGYVLALLALEGYQRITVITFLVPLLALAVPLLDTGLSIVRRIRRGAGILQADRLHMHHRLLSEYRGAHRPAVLSIYFLTACFCVIALSFARLHGYAVIVFLIVVLLLTIRFLRNLGFIDAADADEPPEVASRGAEQVETVAKGEL